MLVVPFGSFWTIAHPNPTNPTGLVPKKPPHSSPSCERTSRSSQLGDLHISQAAPSTWPPYGLSFSAVLSPKFGCLRWFSKTSINHVCIAIKFTCNLHINACCVCDLVCIYVCTFRIFQNYLELNPFGVVENNMSKHGSWTLLDCPSEFQGKAEPKSRSRPLCHYVSSFPKWKMTVITVGIIHLKLKDVKNWKNGTSNSGLHITYRCYSKGIPSAELKYREMVISTLSKAKWYWCQYNDTGATFSRQKSSAMRVKGGVKILPYQPSILNDQATSGPMLAAFIWKGQQ